MTRQALVDKIAKEVKITKKQSSLALDSILDGITKALKKGDKVVFVGFGTFSVRHRAARKGRNPRTGAAIRIAAKKVPVFKAGQKLRDAVG